VEILIMRTRKFAFALLIAAALVIGAISQRTSTGSTSQPVQSNAKARLDAARKVYQGIMERHQIEPNRQPLDFENLCLWSRRWMDAQRDISDEKSNQLEAIDAHLIRVRDLEKIARAWVQVNAITSFECSAVEFHRLEAEHWLAQTRAR
jgi:hypothetical protein